MKFKIREARLKESVGYDSEGNPLSPEQVAFFKNSKVRDRQGRLLVCYHGSSASFDTFDPNFIGTDNKLGLGFYFTNGKKLQFQYDAVYKCYLNIVNPVYEGTDLFDDVLEFESAELSEGKSVGKVLGGIQLSFGIDGVIGDPNNHDAIVAFNSNQIKAITNKNPSNGYNINESAINEVYPNKGESKEDFIKRFMSVTKDEYPDRKTRFAVANSYWERRNKK